MSFLIDFLTLIVSTACKFVFRKATIHFGTHADKSKGPPPPAGPIRPPDTPEFAARRKEVYHIAFLLRQKLVPDVVPIILNYAELFYTESRLLEYDPPLDVHRHKLTALAFVSRPINCRARLKHPVKKVVFEIEALRHRWDPNMEKSTWTWFEACHWRQSSNTIVQKFMCREIARSTFLRRRLEWRSNDQDENIAKWVSALQAGELVDLSAWGRFPGSTGAIRATKVTVHTAIVF